ncbi:MAG: rhomboid family intramembrane serine protease [Thermoflexaceae bacterium]|nr:rhomboid family intramembrane serine protease [Thermoflexaceae bacterium]
MIDFIQEKLQEAGYKRIGVNYPDVALYCRAYPGRCYVLNIVDYKNPAESLLNTEALVSLNNSVVSFLKNKGFAEVDVIHLIVTYSEYVAEDLAGGRIHYWVLDNYHDSFIIPYGQPEKLDNADVIIRQAIGLKTYPSENITGMEKVKKKKKPVKILTMNNLMIFINIIVFMILESLGSTQNSYFMLEHGAFYWPSIKIHGEIYRFFTCIFIHFGFSHLFGNMIVLFFLGDNLERAVGKIKYVIIYLATGLAGSLVSCIYYLIIDEYVLSGGASGAIFGVVGALVYIVTANRGKLEDLDSFRLILFVAFSFYSGFTSTGVDNAAHVGGFVAGLILGKFLYKKSEQIQY